MPVSQPTMCGTIQSGFVAGKPRSGLQKTATNDYIAVGIEEF